MTDQEVGEPVTSSDDSKQDPPEVPQITVPFGIEAYETVELRQHMLGIHPYVLVQAVVVDADDDDDDGLRLRVESGAGAHGGELALLYVTNLPPSQNPLTAAARAMIDRYPDAREVLEGFADYVGFPLPALSDETESVDGQP